MAVVVDAKDENAVSFYRHYGFPPLAGQVLRCTTSRARGLPVHARRVKPDRRAKIDGEYESLYEKK